MRHVILGRGVLGSAIEAELRKDSHHKIVTPRFPPWRFGDDWGYLNDTNPDVVWNCVGWGSVAEAKADFPRSTSIHMVLPVELLLKLNAATRVVNFSSDYARAPNSSLYAGLKSSMEMMTRKINRHGSFCFRIGSLYGPHFPERTFPGKVRARFPVPSPETIQMPINSICPTPTPWLAEELVRRVTLGDSMPSEIPALVSPSGSTTTLEWAQLILGPGYSIRGVDFDYERPTWPSLCQMPQAPFWRGLWDRYEVAK